MPLIVINPEEKDVRKIVNSVRQLAEGRSNAHGTFTLATSTTSTTVTSVNCGAESTVSIMPTTANAAAAMSGIYIEPVNGSFTVTHASNGETDRTFRYAVQG